ncbi:uncharacterized protein LOC111297817 [Durio zibethinus]|uniref:Uncharacterized protein LOC111297817 n=1 Tax=Durio zibethinus TaxID=66656 RepID=A0A6P5Z6H7_DURZI|nr:uncharacterized protein LOC111297817 [Durio zibethinus]
MELKISHDPWICTRNIVEKPKLKKPGEKAIRNFHSFSIFHSFLCNIFSSRLQPNPKLCPRCHEDPIGSGLATGAIVEAAGPECIVPGQITPIRLLGLKVWPIEVDKKFLEPVSKELKFLGKFMEDAVNIMNKSFIDR